MIILPDKTIRVGFSVVGVGAILLQNIDSVETVSSLWSKVKVYEEIGTFEKFIAALVLLYSSGAILYNNGVIEKVLVNMEKEAINIEKTRNPGIYAD